MPTPAESKNIPTFIEVGDQEGQLSPTLAELLPSFGISPDSNNRYMTFALLDVLQRLEQHLKTKNEANQDKDAQLKKAIELRNYLRTVFAVIDEIEAQQAAAAEAEKPVDPKDQPMYEDVTPFVGKPITKNQGPYSLPARVFNPLSKRVGFRYVPAVLMADAVAVQSENFLSDGDHLGEKAMYTIQELLRRIYQEAQGGIKGSTFLAEVPSMYYDIHVSADEFEFETLGILEKLDPAIFVEDGTFIDLYAVATLVESDFELGDPSDPTGKMVLAEVRQVLAKHANDIYLKK